MMKWWSGGSHHLVWWRKWTCCVLPPYLEGANITSKTRTPRMVRMLPRFTVCAPSHKYSKHARTLLKRRTDAFLDISPSGMGTHGSRRDESQPMLFIFPVHRREISREELIQTNKRKAFATHEHLLYVWDGDFFFAWDIETLIYNRDANVFLKLPISYVNE